MKIKFIVSVLIALILWFKLPAQIKVVTPVYKKRPAKTWAVVIGISTYKNIVGLNYADRDAKVFYNYLTNLDGGPKIIRSQVKLLLNENALSAEIYGALDWLHANVSKGDRVIFYFSGHADVENKTKVQNGFLLAYNSPSVAYATSGTVSIKYLQAYLKSYITINKAAHVILIADACRSGKLAGGSDGAKLTRLALDQNWNKNITRMLSGQEDEISLESNKWGQGRGVFSYYLLKGMEGLANRDRDSLIVTSELAAYVTLAVANATGHTQNPLFEGNPNEVLFSFNQKLLAQTKNDDSVSFKINNIDNDGLLNKLLPLNKTYYKKYINYVRQGRLVWAAMRATLSIAQNFIMVN